MSYDKSYSIVCSLINVIHNNVFKNKNNSNIYYCMFEKEIDILNALHTLILTQKNVKSKNNIFVNMDVYFNTLNTFITYIRTQNISFIEIDMLMNMFNTVNTIIRKCMHNIGYNILFTTHEPDLNLQDVIDLFEQTCVPLIDIKQLSKNTYMLLCFDLNYYRKNNTTLRETIDYTSKKIVKSFEKCNVQYIVEDDTYIEYIEPKVLEFNIISI